MPKPVVLLVVGREGQLDRCFEKNIVLELKPKAPGDVIDVVKQLSPDFIMLSTSDFLSICEVRHKVTLGPGRERGDKRDERLSEREREILFWLFRGLTNREIAQQYGLSTRTIKAYLAALFLKLDVSNRTELVGRAIELGILTGS